MTALRRAGRWLRIHGGLVFTDRQILERWDALGGPKPLENWSLQRRRNFYVSRLIGSATTTILIVASHAWQGAQARYLLALGAGLMVGIAAVLAFAIGPAWRRQRSLYNSWLSRQARAAAAAPSSDQQSMTQG